MMTKHSQLSKSVEILDGGTGEELQRLGLPDDRQIWSARALVDQQYHDLVRRVHQNFIQAGARYITTNNYAEPDGLPWPLSNKSPSFRILDDQKIAVKNLLKSKIIMLNKCELNIC